jgi:hypothetical protein
LSSSSCSHSISSCSAYAILSPSLAPVARPASFLPAAPLTPATGLCYSIEESWSALLHLLVSIRNLIAGIKLAMVLGQGLRLHFRKRASATDHIIPQSIVPRSYSGAFDGY